MRSHTFESGDLFSAVVAKAFGLAAGTGAEVAIEVKMVMRRMECDLVFILGDYSIMDRYSILLR